MFEFPKKKGFTAVFFDLLLKLHNANTRSDLAKVELERLKYANELEVHRKEMLLALQNKVDENTPLGWQQDLLLVESNLDNALFVISFFKHLQYHTSMNPKEYLGVIEKLRIPNLRLIDRSFVLSQSLYLFSLIIFNIFHLKNLRLMKSPAKDLLEQALIVQESIYSYIAVTQCIQYQATDNISELYYKNLRDSARVFIQDEAESDRSSCEKSMHKIVDLFLDDLILIESNIFDGLKKQESLCHQLLDTTERTEESEAKLLSLQQTTDQFSQLEALISRLNLDRHKEKREQYPDTTKADRCCVISRIQLHTHPVANKIQTFAVLSLIFNKQYLDQYALSVAQKIRRYRLSVTQDFDYSIMIRCLPLMDHRFRVLYFDARLLSSEMEASLVQCPELKDTASNLKVFECLVAGIKILASSAFNPNEILSEIDRWLVNNIVTVDIKGSTRNGYPSDVILNAYLTVISLHNNMTFTTNDSLQSRYSIIAYLNGELIKLMTDENNLTTRISRQFVIENYLLVWHLSMDHGLENPFPGYYLVMKTWTDGLQNQKIYDFLMRYLSEVVVQIDVNSGTRTFHMPTKTLESLINLGTEAIDEALVGMKTDTLVSIPLTNLFIEYFCSIIGNLSQPQAHFDQEKCRQADAALTRLYEYANENAVRILAEYDPKKFLRPEAFKQTEKEERDFTLDLNLGKFHPRSSGMKTSKAQSSQKSVTQSNAETLRRNEPSVSCSFSQVRAHFDNDKTQILGFYEKNKKRGDSLYKAYALLGLIECQLTFYDELADKNLSGLIKSQARDALDACQRKRLNPEEVSELEKRYAQYSEQYNQLKDSTKTTKPNAHVPAIKPKSPAEHLTKNSIFTKATKNKTISFTEKRPENSVVQAKAPKSTAKASKLPTKSVSAQTKVTRPPTNTSKPVSGTAVVAGTKSPAGRVATQPSTLAPSARDKLIKLGFRPHWIHEKELPTNFAPWVENVVKFFSDRGSLPMVQGSTPLDLLFEVEYRSISLVCYGELKTLYRELDQRKEEFGIATLLEDPNIKVLNIQFADNIPQGKFKQLTIAVITPPVDATLSYGDLLEILAAGFGLNTVVYYDPLNELLLDPLNLLPDLLAKPMLKAGSDKTNLAEYFEVFPERMLDAAERYSKYHHANKHYEVDPTLLATVIEKKDHLQLAPNGQKRWDLTRVNKLFLEGLAREGLQALMMFQLFEILFPMSLHDARSLEAVCTNVDALLEGKTFRTLSAKDCQVYRAYILGNFFFRCFFHTPVYGEELQEPLYPVDLFHSDNEAFQGLVYNFLKQTSLSIDDELCGEIIKLWEHVAQAPNIAPHLEANIWLRANISKEKKKIKLATATPFIFMQKNSHDTQIKAPTSAESTDIQTPEDLTNLPGAPKQH